MQTRLPTSSERTDTALTLARTKAAAYADAGKMEMAYRALLRGVQSAQRVNSSSQTGTALAGLWAMPAVKALVLGGAATIAAAVTRSKAQPKAKPKSERKSRAKSTATSGDPASPSESSVQPRSRFRRRPRANDEVTTVPDPSVSSKLDG